MADSTPTEAPDSQPESDSAAYRVLARTYRPQTFSALIGQDVMVRTLTNAFASGRLAHAFILTGVRGVGKTTTARIIARALNCIGPDGNGGPTTEPCGVCEHCKAIAEDRHIDVLEMDAASHTGVDGIRDIIDGVRYLPTTARNKVYIIDEVHMLSKNAFNALLKTLEEPPEHVKFVFATTEIRKVPVTVLSRCQRFDLARVDTETLAAHFTAIAAKETAAISETAVHLIARAADGSVRDGLSLLDQAISQATGEITEDQVRDMLGLVDRSQTFMLLESIMAGDTAPALQLFEQMYRDGADPAAVLEDMLEITHWLTRIKIVPAAAEGRQVPEVEQVRGVDLEQRLSMAALARAWQMLLKGLQEVRHAPAQRQAAEMVLVRLAYTSQLPTPEEALKSLDGGGEASAAPVSSATAAAPDGGSMAPAAATISSEAPAEPAPQSPPPETMLPGTGDAVPQAVAEPQPQPQTPPVAATPPRPAPATFEDVLALADQHREGRLRTHLMDNLRLVAFEPGRIEFNPGEHAPRDLAGRLTSFLNDHTDMRWVVTVSRDDGGATLGEQRNEDAHQLRAEALEHPLVKAVMETFPGATVDRVEKTSAPGGSKDEPDIT